ncbi:nudC domain-containing protein 1 isoform X2 [Lycorma delicatula]|uniref:nudC domain-containing protein 1 isoform X2 n=1 Tax=Lycorma delicatula TaxID=130591 RepID=UPI003F5165B7
MKTVSELRPNRHLIDDNFGGYFLSLTSIPSYNIKLECDIDQVYPSDEQYTYIHAKLFSLHNHLFHDLWSKNSLFIIDTAWKVQKCVLNSGTDVLENVQEVWEIPSNHHRVPGHYPTTMCFPSSDLVVVADGAGTLYIVSRQNPFWQVKYGEEVIGKEKPFLIFDCRCECIDSQRLLHTLLLHLELASEDTCTDTDDKRRGVTYVEWITFVEESSGRWSLQCVRQLKGKGLPDYLALEPGCKSIYIVNEFPFKFVTDTENPIEIIEEKGKEVKKKNKIYIWKQNSEEIKVWFTLEKGSIKQNVNVLVNGLKFSVELKGIVLLKGILFHHIDNDLTTWTLEETRLNVILQKHEQGLMWKEFLVDNNDGEEILDESSVQEAHEHLSHLCCDTVYTLTGHQWLFSLKLGVDNAPALCVRHDVHGCLWQPEPLKDSAEWTCTHLCTFPAFGYVHASKQNRKFLLCATDTSYTVICEANNHIYIYNKNANKLRNRRPGGNERTQVGKLNCIKMETSDPILGAFSTVSYLFILTKNRLYQYHITNS